MELTRLERPEGMAAHYRLFVNEATGRIWKVKLELREGEPALVNAPVQLAPSSFAVTVSASPVEDGSWKALRDSEGRPIVTDSHTHLFRETEVAAEGFSAEARIMSLIRQRIEAGERALEGLSQLKAFAEGW